MVKTMAKLRMAHASTHGAREPPGPKIYVFTASIFHSVAAAYTNTSPLSMSFLYFMVPDILINFLSIYIHINFSGGGSDGEL